jgi:hypothetical protein
MTAEQNSFSTALNAKQSSDMNIWELKYLDTRGMHLIEGLNT